MTKNIQSRPFNEFISDFRSELKSLFDERNVSADTIYQRGFTDVELSRIMSHVPLSVSIPTEYGGRGIKVKECISLLEAASYESLPLSLIFGINFALFLEPFAKYGQADTKADVFRGFLQEQKMGGLMISEPDHGSDALNIQTNHVKNEQGYKLSGTKHWQGLSGMADYWLVASRAKNDKGELGRDISLFLTDNSNKNQTIPCEELYENNGLYPIPYGRNKIDIQLPENHLLIPESTGLKMIMDTLHRSRMQFPGMAMGFLRRILEEATEHVNTRLIRGNSLLQFDQVKKQLSELQSAFTICSAMCHYSTKVSAISNNLATLGMEANTIKARVTDLMQNSAQTLMQLLGSGGYHINSLGSRGIMDSRPFQIFEGPNEMLYSQVSEGVTKAMTRKKMSLIEYFENYEPTKNVISYFKDLLNVPAEKSMAQRKHVLMGNVISRVVTAGYVHDLGAAGFSAGLVSNAIDTIKKEIEQLINSYKSGISVSAVEDIDTDSKWLKYCD